MKKSRRKVVVLTSLVAFLTLTSALLLVIAPPPLTAEIYHPLLASDSADNLDAIFKTATPMTGGRWQYIYIHQSATESGDAGSLGGQGGQDADHFVIGNGNGCPDGEIEMTPRWMKQEAASPPAGAAQIDPNCISICLVGDFDTASPTPMQMNRVAELVSTLQSRLHLGGQQVIIKSDGRGQAGIGRYFPETALRDQILP